MKAVDLFFYIPMFIAILALIYLCSVLYSEGEVTIGICGLVVGTAMFIAYARLFSWDYFENRESESIKYTQILKR